MTSTYGPKADAFRHSWIVHFFDDQRPISALSIIFGWTEEKTKTLVKAAIEKLPPWSEYTYLDKNAEFMNSVLPALGRLGLPNNPFCHQQPYDFVRQLPLSADRDSSECEGELEGVDVFMRQIIQQLWTIYLDELIDMYEEEGLVGDELLKWVLLDLLLIGGGLVFCFGSLNTLNQQIQAEQLIYWNNWFKFTRGCFDEHGILVDRETAALRKFEEMGWQRELVRKLRRQRKSGSQP